jgi:hypothetical protein
MAAARDEIARVTLLRAPLKTTTIFIKIVTNGILAFVVSGTELAEGGGFSGRFFLA